MKKSILTKKIKSFTLIELIVVISIIMVSFGLSLARYNEYSSQLKLKNEARKLVDVLELSKKKALSVDLLVTPNVTPPTYCNNFTGYQVSLYNGSYSINYCCNSDCSTKINNYNLSSKLSIVSPLIFPANFDFPPLMKGFSLTDSSIKLKNSTINKCVIISISAVGTIELDETLVSC